MQIFLRLAYDGTGFHGSARQRGPDGRDRVRTVAQVVSEAVAGLYGRELSVRFASRTDAGVHARGQLAAFVPVLPIPVQGVRKALDDRLPGDVAVVDAFEVPDGADVRRDNGGKIYRYRVAEGRVRDPMSDRYLYRVGAPLDVDAMAAAGRALTGRHDYAAFRAADCQARTTVRTLRRVEVRRQGEPPGGVVEVEVEGDAFLKNMVRIVAGTLIEVGRGKWTVDDAARPLRTLDRRDAGPTAPARGLELVEVLWPGPRGS